MNSDLTFKNQWTNGARLYVTVPVNEDFIVESTERFKARLNTVDSGLVPVNPSTAIVTVFDNDSKFIRLTFSRKKWLNDIFFDFLFSVSYI